MFRTLKGLGSFKPFLTTVTQCGMHPFQKVPIVPVLS